MPKNQLRRIIDTKRIPAVSIMTVGIPVDGGVAPPPTGMVPTTRTIAGTSPIRINGGASATLAGNITVSVLIASNGGIVNSGGLAVQLANNGGLEYVGGIRAKVPTASGILRNSSGLQLAPADITLTSSNTLVNHAHAHNIVTSAAPTNAQILQSNDTGGLALTRLDTPVVGTTAGALRLTAITDVDLEPVQEVILNPGTYVLLDQGKSIRTTGFGSGFAGAGAALEHVYSVSPAVNKTVFTVDDLWVRGTMHVYELLIHQIRATNGSIFVTSVGKASVVTGTTTFTITTDPEHGFLPNDIIRAQRWNGGAPYQSTLRVVTVVNTYIFTAVKLDGVNPIAGYEYVRLGNTTNLDRQGGIYMTADDANAPYLEVFDGVSSLALWNTPAVRKLRLGNLAGSYNYPSLPKIYGFAAGKSDEAHITIEDTNGLRIRYNTSTRLQIRLDGDLLMFAGDESDPAKAHIWFTHTGQAYINSRLLIGQDGEIRQGTIWNGTTYVTDDGRDFVDDAGALAVQFNGTRMWQQGSVGRIGGYRRGVKQWEADNEGMIAAGGGNVTLQAKGLVFKRATSVGYGTDEVLAITRNSVSWMNDPLTDVAAFANIVGGTHASGAEEMPFLRLSISNINPSDNGAWIGMESRIDGEYLWFSNFNVIAGIPGSFFSMNGTTGQGNVVFGQDGRGDFFTIADNTTTRIGGHWVPSTNNTKLLGVPSLRWANVYAVNADISGTATIHTLVITGTTTESGEVEAADIHVAGNIVVGGTVDGVSVSALDTQFWAHVGDTNIHHNRSHNLLADDHYITGQEAGDVLIVTSPTTFGFFPLSDALISVMDVADTASINMTWSGGTLSAVVVASGINHNSLSGRGANDHHNQQHSINGTDHTGELDWAKVSKTGSNLTDLVTRAHGSLTGIGANDHHNQSHAFDSTDHTGTLSWAKVSKAGSNLTDIATRPHSALSGITANDHHPQVHALVSTNHTATGLTEGHFLRALTDTTFAFAEIGLVDLPNAGGSYKMLRSDGAGNNDWEDIATLAGAGIAHTNGVLSVAPGTMITVNPDGVQITDGAAHQFIGTGSGAEATWLDLHTLAGDSLTYEDDVFIVNYNHNFSWTGTHQFADTVQIQATLTTRSMFPEETDLYNIGSPLLLYNQSFISQMNAVLYAENTAQLIGGWFIIPKYAGKMGAVSGEGEYTNIDLGIADVGVISDYDFIVVRAHDVNGDVKTEYMQVAGHVSGTVWMLTRDMTNPMIDPNPIWAAGTPYMLLGNSGDGRIELNAHDTPRVSVVTQGFLLNQQYEYVRMGDLVDNWGYDAQTWGFAAGRYGIAAHTWITVDPTNGIRLGNNTDVIGQWDSTGKIIIGKVANNKPRIEIDDTDGFRILHRDGTSTDQTLIQLSVTGNATLTGVLGLGLSGGIYQGSGSFTTPDTGLKIWNDAGIGRLATYNATVQQVSINSSGQLIAGAGTVVVDADGIAALTDVNYVTDRRGYQFKNADDVVGGFWSAYSVPPYESTYALLSIGTTSDGQPTDKTSSTLDIRARSGTGGGSASIDMQAVSHLSSKNARIRLTTSGVSGIIIEINTSSIISMLPDYTSVHKPLRMSGGSAAEPNIADGSAPYNGIWFPSTSSIGISTIGINRVTISATGIAVAGAVNATNGFVATQGGAPGTYVPYSFTDTGGERTGMLGRGTLYVGLAVDATFHLLTRTDGGSESYLKLGYGISNNNRAAYVDFHTNIADPTGWSARIIRNLGANGTLVIANEGTGNAYIQVNGTAVAIFQSNSHSSFAGALFPYDGTANIPAHSFLSDTNTGMYLGAADTLSFSTGGTRRAELTSTGFWVINQVEAGTYVRSPAYRNIITVAANTKYSLGTLICLVAVTSVGGSGSLGGLFFCRNLAVTMISGGGFTVDGSGTTHSVYHDGTEYVYHNKTASPVSVGIFHFARG